MPNKITAETLMAAHDIVGNYTDGGEGSSNIPSFGWVLDVIMAGCGLVLSEEEQTQLALDATRLHQRQKREALERLSQPVSLVDA